MLLILGKVLVVALLLSLYFFGIRLYFLYLMLVKKNFKKVMTYIDRCKKDISWCVCYVLRKSFRIHDIKTFTIQNSLILSPNNIPYSVRVFKDKRKRLDMDLPKTSPVCGFDFYYEMEDKIVSIMDMLEQRHIKKVIDSFIVNAMPLVIKLKE